MSFTTAHEPVIAAFREGGALPSAHAEVMALLRDRVRIEPDGSARILDESGLEALDPDDGYQPMTAEGFVQSLKCSRPWIFTMGAKRETLTAEVRSASGRTVTDLTIAARKGDAAAQAELERRMNPGNSSQQKPNLTQLMAKARAGDADAHRALDTFFSTNRS